MVQISENQCRPSLVHSHPPIPTVSPSAIASAADMQRLGSRRTSDFLRTLRLPTSMTLAEADMWRPGTGLMTTALQAEKEALPHAGMNVV